eukprot:8182922-Alexandrium_andersonii.AAC.1
MCIRDRCKGGAAEADLLARCFVRLVVVRLLGWWVRWLAGRVGRRLAVFAWQLGCLAGWLSVWL